jgi:hypothetical protein
VASPSQSKPDLLERALALKGTQTDLAEAMGMDRSRLNRVIKRERFGIANCLKLAAVIDELPHVVLRAFGYAVEADILQEAYTEPRFRQTQVKVAELYANASPERKRMVMVLLTEGKSARTQGADR